MMDLFAVLANFSDADPLAGAIGPSCLMPIDLFLVMGRDNVKKDVADFACRAQGLVFGMGKQAVPAF